MRNLKKQLWLLCFVCILNSCTNEDAILINESNTEEQETEETDTTTEEEEAEEETEIPVDVATELIANDLEPHPMQDLAKPGYLETIVDPSFGTIIRRISNAGNGGVIKPMYSTIQAWNADETRMILYDQTNGVHQLLDGMSYEFIRNLDAVRPDDLEQLFWDFN
ncbi:hypothetical protein [Maribacter sp.]|nr:hypothetical protein [Maribacter sp.]HDZ06100.1 hypothetical protein [Maribacter sp.]